MCHCQIRAAASPHAERNRIDQRLEARLGFAMLLFVADLARDVANGATLPHERAGGVALDASAIFDPAQRAVARREAVAELERTGGLVAAEHFAHGALVVWMNATHEALEQ